MFTLMLHAFIAVPDIPEATLYDTQVLAETCGRRLVADWDADLGERQLFVQDVFTDDVLYSEVAPVWVDVEDRADTLDLCGLAG